MNARLRYDIASDLRRYSLAGIPASLGWTTSWQSIDARRGILYCRGYAGFPDVLNASFDRSGYGTGETGGKRCTADRRYAERFRQSWCPSGSAGRARDNFTNQGADRHISGNRPVSRLHPILGGPDGGLICGSGHRSARTRRPNAAGRASAAPYSDTAEPRECAEIIEELTPELTVMLSSTKSATAPFTTQISMRSYVHSVCTLSS